MREGERSPTTLSGWLVKTVQVAKRDYFHGSLTIPLMDFFSFDFTD